jgi:regulator of replication initiation timing
MRKVIWIPEAELQYMKGKINLLEEEKATLQEENKKLRADLVDERFANELLTAQEGECDHVWYDRPSVGDTVCGKCGIQKLTAQEEEA